ncbi:four helix bundle protein [Runella sp. CRIBMP]|jgi:four helix bundle protein|uniref:four helix bundle protein n=1 Tax=Runella sp. CRIBMP TaxID=2683261 RepID=UPI0014126C9B|nr:four helix bundle protein [Runella sp. CRIBMP]NBB22185.1 four helix bundle protein [Runella sp. CRIBMP]
MAKSDNVTYEKGYAFAIRVVKAYQFLSEDKKEFILSKQLLRSGTSIGANIAEANGAISKSDFSAKMSIAYKECLETKYWLSLLKDTGYIEQKAFESIYNDADELAKILFSILKTTRINPIKMFLMWFW